MERRPACGGDQPPKPDKEECTAPCQWGYNDPMRSMLWSLMFVSLAVLPLLALAYYVVIMLYAQRL